MKSRNHVAPNRLAVAPHGFAGVLSLLVALLPLVFYAAPEGRAAQVSAPEQRREQLLNGLKIILVHRPEAPEVTLKLRVHSGAAFDLAGKEGMTALLGDALFSDPTTREYVTQELGGRLEVETDFDSIEVTLSGPAKDFERLVELLRNALVSTQLSAETVARLREARIKSARENSLAPASVADRAIAARLFGDYPYGRTVGGTTETLARIDRPDLMLARERFLNPNNATLVSIGGVAPARAMRTFRQFLGVWRRSDRDVPATFRQPVPHDARTLVVDLPGATGAQVRLAARGLARSDRDLAAASVLALVVRERWQAAAPELKDGAPVVRHDAHALGGIFTLSAAVRSSEAAAQAIESARAILRSLITTPPSVAEVETARSAALTNVRRVAGQPDALAENWLDEYTYFSGVAGAAESARAFDALTPADIQRVAARIFRDGQVASVAVGEAARLRQDLARTGGVEVFDAGLTTDPKAATTPAPPNKNERFKRP